MVLFDVTGRAVLNLFEGEAASGQNHVILNTAILPPGIYSCRLTAGGTKVVVKKVVVVR
jgi:hypothetical protein